jgi:ABC-type sugar transport system permease subunit
VSYQRRIAWWGIAFAAPALAFLLLFNITPMLRALYLSFTNYRMGAEASFIGLDNYVQVLGGSSFRNALRVSVVYVFGTVIPVWFISFTLAYLLYRVPRARGVWRTLLFLPTVMPLLTVTLVWKLFFNYRGVINTILSPFLAEPIPWLTTAAWAPLALIITSWWHAASYYMILFLAGLQAIPAVYDEAAQLNGANGRQRLWYVTLPLMRPTIALVFVLSIIKGFRTFALQHVMTGGGPGTATEIVTLLIYKTAFNFGKFGEAAAISLLYFLVILAFSLLQLRLLRGNRGVE